MADDVGTLDGLVFKVCWIHEAKGGIPPLARVKDFNVVKHIIALFRCVRQIRGRPVRRGVVLRQETSTKSHKIRRVDMSQYLQTTLMRLKELRHN